MDIEIFQVDAFTDTPFSGNPAGVCILSKPRDERWMQNIAMEMNLSETAFLLERDDGFNLRWFTPAVEVELCGHATLASAHVLWETDYLKADEQVKFQTKSGVLKARKKDDWIEMDFPSEPEEPCEPHPEIEKALGVKSKYIGKNRFDYIVEVASAKTVRDMQPDFAMLRRIQTRGVIVTSRSDSSVYDFISRFFAPNVGVDEDPVTGSAHCCLTPFWSARIGKDEMTAYQASKRGGIVRLKMAGDRVSIAGKAVIVMCAHITQIASADFKY